MVILTVHTIVCDVIRVASYHYADVVQYSFMSENLFSIPTVKMFFVQQQFSVSVKAEFSKNSELLLGQWNFRLCSMFTNLNQCVVVMIILTGLLGRQGMISHGLKTTSETPIHEYSGGF